MKIHQSTLSIESRWGSPARHLLETHSKSSTLVVVFPGSNYPITAPLLHYARLAALERGLDVLSLEYGFQAHRGHMERNDIPVIAEEALQALSAVPQSYETLVFVSKSLGTVVASQVQQHLPTPIRHQIFLTPLSAAIGAMGKTPHSLVIVGTADPLFDHDDVALVSDLNHVELHTVPYANHGLEVSNYLGSLRILQDVAQWCDDFFQNIR